MKSTQPTNPVLVFGATGRHGNTGAYVARRLRQEGRLVRVLARQHSERTEQLCDLGAEVVVGDLHDRRTVVSALGDVDLVYFTYPIAAGIVSAAANFAEAVHEVGRRPRTVVMSMGPAHPAHPSRLGRDQWLAEQVMQRSGLDVLILRIAALFHQNLLVLHAKSIRRHGVFRNSFGNNAIAWINGGDAAELAVAALLHPDRFDGPVAYPSGPESFDHAGIAAMLTELTGREIAFEPIAEESWRRELLELSDADQSDVVNDAMAQHIAAVGAVIARNGPSGTPDAHALKSLIGREPTRLRDFLADNLDAFGRSIANTPA